MYVYIIYIVCTVYDKMNRKVLYHFAIVTTINDINFFKLSNKRVKSIYVYILYVVKQH